MKAESGAVWWEIEADIGKVSLLLSLLCSGSEEELFFLRSNYKMYPSQWQNCLSISVAVNKWINLIKSELYDILD